jgi:hypothetical protein
MVEAARHVIYVGTEMRDEWFNFWQEAQHIYRASVHEKDAGKRAELLKQDILEPVPDGRSRMNLRDRYARVEEVARDAIQEELAATPGTPGLPGGSSSP